MGNGVVCLSQLSRPEVVLHNRKPACARAKACAWARKVCGVSTLSATKLTHVCYTHTSGGRGWVAQGEEEGERVRVIEMRE